MKKILAILLAVLLCMMMFASCNEKNVDDTNDTNNKEETQSGEDDALADFRETISDSGAAVGIAYLGYVDGEFDDIMEYCNEIGLYKTFPFVKNMGEENFFESDGNELYLVVPADDDAKTDVYKGAPNFETYEVDKSELLGSTEDGSPFFVRGNESDIFPNIVLVCEDLEITPYLSLENGLLAEEQGVYDFSPYEAIKKYLGIDESNAFDGADPIFSGTWFCEKENADYELFSAVLNISPNGAADYSYGYADSEVLELFEGEWEYDINRDMLLFNMSGGMIDEDFEYTDPYTLSCGFKWNMDYRDDGTYLVLIHEEGDPILPGTNGATFEFAIATDREAEDYTYLIGSWGIISEKTEIYLELFDDCSAHYYLTRDGVTETDIYGSWYAEALTLYLNLGADESGEEFDLSGAYGIMYDGELLTLSILDDYADPLTAFMAENGYDGFILCGVG